MKKVLLLTIFLLPALVFAAPNQSQRLERNISPETDSTWRLGTTSKAWLEVISDAFYDTDASDGCATWSSNVLTSSGVACATAHDPVTLSGVYDYITLSGQDIIRGLIDLATDITGTLPIANGGTGATTLNDLITLGTHTTGNYVATIADSGNSTITVNNSGSETAGVTLDVIDLNCTDCLNATEIEDIYLLNTGDTATGDYTFDTTTLHVDSINNMVGIGTTTPQSELSVAKDGASATIIVSQNGDFFPQLELQRTGGSSKTDRHWRQTIGNTGGFTIRDVTGSANIFNIEAGASSNSLYIDSSSNVGIGTASPSHKLEVSASGTDLLRLHRDINSNGSGSIINFAFDDSANAIVDIARIVPHIVTNTAGSEDGDISFRVMQGGVMTEVLFLEETGNVGIGTTAPATELDVNGDITIDNGTGLGGLFRGANTGPELPPRQGSYPTTDTWSAQFYQTTSGGSYPFNVFANTVLQASTNPARDLVFVTGSTPTVAMSIDNSGDLDLVSGEATGFPRYLQFGDNAGAMGVTTPTSYLLSTDGVTMRANHGFTAMRAGSITGVSMTYDITQLGSDTTSWALEVRKNGTVVWTNNLTFSVTNDLQSQFTQARGTDTFVAGDSIEVSVTQTGATTDITPFQFNEAIGVLEVVSD